MEASRYLQCLAADYGDLRDAVASVEITATVPSCPGWTVADLVVHVAQVYLHKAAIMRTGEEPQPWPPPGLAQFAQSGAPALPLLGRAYGELRAQFRAHEPGEEVPTWFGPDQTVGFWIRRMAQETVIHRIDAELAVGEPVVPIPDDLAGDGIDELLRIFLAYDEETWAEEAAPVLAKSPGRRVAVRVPGAEWMIETSPTSLAVTTAFGAAIGRLDETHVDAAITGPAPAVLRRLWNRGGDPVTESGDQAALVEVRALLTAATQ